MRKIRGNSTYYHTELLISALILVVLWPGLLPAAEEPSHPSIIEVESEGEVLAKPDLAILIVNLETEAPQAQAAAAANAKRTEGFLPALKKLLAPEEKLQSQSYRIYPLFRYREKDKTRTQEIYAYRAQHTFRMELRDLAKIGKVYDAALQHGATRVQGPYWDHTRKEELQREAAVLALKRAQELAAALAQAAGMKVVRPIKLSTLHHVRPMPVGVARMAQAAAPGGAPETTVEVGEEKFQARITATFELAP